MQILSERISRFTRDHFNKCFNYTVAYACMYMYMKRKHSKMHFMLMHSNEVVIVKYSECRLKHMTEVHSWDQEAATKTIE
jgi:hypothetical protein